MDYGMLLFVGETEYVLQKIEATYMTVNRIIQGGYTYHTNKSKICKVIEVDLPRQAMCKASVKFIHKHLLH